MRALTAALGDLALVVLGLFQQAFLAAVFLVQLLHLLRRWLPSRASSVVDGLLLGREVAGDDQRRRDQVGLVFQLADRQVGAFLGLWPPASGACWPPASRRRRSCRRRPAWSRPSRPSGAGRRRSGRSGGTVGKGAAAGPRRARRSAALGVSPTARPLRRAMCVACQASKTRVDLLGVGHELGMGQDGGLDLACARPGARCSRARRRARTESCSQRGEDVPVARPGRRCRAWGCRRADGPRCPAGLRARCCRCSAGC